MLIYEWLVRLLDVQSYERSMRTALSKAFIVQFNWEHTWFSMKMILGSNRMIASSYAKNGLLSDLHSSQIYIYEKKRRSRLGKRN